MKRLDMTLGLSSEEVENTIRISMNAKNALSHFIGATTENKFVSLGQNCSSAWYLKQLGVKQASYPFDWIFSSTEIVHDCLKNNFQTYLDRSLYIEKNEKSAGHSVYHTSFFNHRNPLNEKEDYQYYERACARFINLMNSKEHVFYIITLINEPAKRSGWANGFTKHFPMPTNQSLDTTLNLINFLKNKNSNAKFIVIDHSTESNDETAFQHVSDSVFFISFCAKKRSTGVFYVDLLDDFCFKLIFTGLFGKAVPKESRKSSIFAKFMRNN